MQKILFLLVFLPALASGQSCVEVDRFFTAGFHYLTTGKAAGFQFEIGSSGSESNFSYYGTVTAFRERHQVKDTARTFPDMVFGGKGAFRFIRAENILSVYVTGTAGVDMVQGFYSAASLKFLTILGGKVALSIEPSYLPRQRTYLTQVGVNIILD